MFPFQTVFRNSIIPILGSVLTLIMVLVFYKRLVSYYSQLGSSNKACILTRPQISDRTLQTTLV